MSIFCLRLKRFSVSIIFVKYRRVSFFSQIKRLREKRRPTSAAAAATTAETASAKVATHVGGRVQFLVEQHRSQVVGRQTGRRRLRWRRMDRRRPVQTPVVVKRRQPRLRLRVHVQRRD